MALAEFIPGYKLPQNPADHAIGARRYQRPIESVIVDFMRPPEHGISTVAELVYFGSSPKREALARNVAENLGMQFRRLPGGKEAKGAPPIDVASGKIEHGLTVELPKIISADSKKLRTAVAGDVLVYVDVVRNSRVQQEPRGKPDKLSIDLPILFTEMIHTAETTGDSSYYGYSIAAGSESTLLQGLAVKDSNRSNGQFIHIGLDENAVRDFATAIGARHLIDTSRRFLTSIAFRNSLNRCSSPADACAGIEIAALAELGAITSIDRVKRQNAGFFDKLRVACKIAYVGFDDEIFSLVHPKAPDIARQWPWFNQVTEQILKNAA